MSSVKIQTAAGNTLSCVSISVNGTELKHEKGICNIPTFVPKNVFGKETYITVLEPVEEITDVASLIKPSITFNTVEELVDNFLAFVKKYENSEEKVVEIEYLGYKYLWRPKHKTHYGSYAMEYLIQPIIARYLFAVMPDAGLDADINDMLPYKYNNKGTGKGVFSYKMKFDASINESERDSKTDTTFNAVSGFYTHMNSISGFNTPITAMKVGRDAISEILAFVKCIEKEAGIRLVFNNSRVLDICRAKEFEGFCLIGYNKQVKNTKNVKVLKVDEHPHVCLLFVQKETEAEALEILKAEISDEIEVV